jgi:hypothetical protein
MAGTVHKAMATTGNIKRRPRYLVLVHWYPYCSGIREVACICNLYFRKTTDIVYLDRGYSTVHSLLTVFLHA